MSFSSPATATTSRSPSPATPEPSDSLDLVAVRNSSGSKNSWYLSTMQQFKSIDSQSPWELDNSDFVTPSKVEDLQMLRLDDLIEQHAYEDSPSSLNYPSYILPTQLHPTLTITSGDLSAPSQSHPLVSSSNGPISATKPVPPPAPLHRKQDPTIVNQRVVYPPKESCFNLPILFPSIPEGGTKSRVETQVRVTVDLADISSSSDPLKYDRIGSWKWLKLPPGTATKRRTRKQGRIDPEPHDVLYLSATVVCATPPHNRVLSCSSCQAREAKRVAKKLAARVRPARSDTDSGDDLASNRPTKVRQQEDTSSIIQFNCAEYLDFSTGSVVLPLRITCYCRHHREKVGFNVHLTMIDHTGRVVGSGSSRPIMITDDHKTAPSHLSRQAELVTGFMSIDSEWSRSGNSRSTDSIFHGRAPSKRKQETRTNTKRAKPYDSSNKPNRGSREGSVASIPSPSSALFSLPMTRSPTPSAVLQQLLGSETTPIQCPPQLQHSSNTSDSSSPDTLMTPLDRSPNVSLPEGPLRHEISQASSPVSHTTALTAVMPAHTHPMPFMFFDPHPSSNTVSTHLPIIHRLIPSVGPTHGGIEVTVLGANFYPSLQLNCVFGDVPASSTERWSDNTLVCILPPRATPGVVAVWFDGLAKVEDPSSIPPCLFTYADESDRALMELALQVVGLKMTGKIEDAKNVAMRIVGGSDSDTQSSGNGNMVQLASTPTRDLRPLLFVRANEGEDFENVIVDFLKIVDMPLDHAPNSLPIKEAISYATPSGQTLLHLAAFLGFSTLVSFLINHDVDLDARDRNGYTALHFAALSNSAECTRTLLEAGADTEIVNALGKTPEETATVVKGLFGDEGDLVESSESTTDSEDEEAQWGDAEEDDPTISRRPTRRTPRRKSRNAESSENEVASETPVVDFAKENTSPSVLADTVSENKNEKLEATGIPDAKQAASFIEMIQRTLSQLPAPQGIIPNMPQLPLPPLPHLPNLPGIGIPAVPWGAFPQIPLVFPVFIPMMPGWPSFLGGDQAGDANKEEEDDTSKGMGAGAIRAAQEWRATWEKWVALAVASTARQQNEEMPPPVYTPRDTLDSATNTKHVLEGFEEGSSEGMRVAMASDLRPVDYNVVPMTDQEVNAFAYQPSTKQAEKLQKKHDKMLLIFWLPILLMSFIWAMYSGLQFTFQTLKTALPLKASMR